MSYFVEGWQLPTLGQNLARAGVKRRDFLAFCGALAGLFAAGTVASKAGAAPLTADQIARRLDAVTKPEVVWLQLQECTGCIESALRSGGTTVEEVVLSLLSVNYNEAVMAAAGEAANAALDDTNARPHILVVNGSVPLADNGIYCVIGGKTAKTVLEESAENATAILAVGACAVWGSVQASKPNPTGAVGVDSIVKGKPVINVQGCPPIAEVMAGVVVHLLTFGTIPQLDGLGRPKAFYSRRVHDSCYRRANFDAGLFVESFDDENARKGYCLYKIGCRGPSTYNSCGIIKWNEGTSYPIQSGHPCLGCSEEGFWDNTPFYERRPALNAFGIEATADQIGLAVGAATAVGIAAHAVATNIRKKDLIENEAEPA